MSGGSRDPVIRAAGCVLWRRVPGGGVEVCLVHRPRYDDWSFPKGKLKRGEDPRAAAVREVLEETGHHCALKRQGAGDGEGTERGGTKPVLALKLHFRVFLPGAAVVVSFYDGVR
ncbi:hypothetical protein SBADM41S_04544 [Streptomyces badius]